MRNGSGLHMTMRPGTDTLFIDGSSWLHRSHPFSKLNYVLMSGVMVYLLPWGWAVSGILLLCNLGLAAGCGLFTASLKNLTRIMFPLVMFMLPIHSLLYPENQTVWINVYGLGFYREGCLFAGNTLFRLSAILTASLLFVFTTHPADLISAVSQTAGSPSLAYLIGSPLILLPAMRQRIGNIQSAQRARGLDTQGNFFKRFIGVAPLVAPLVLGSLIEMEQRATALEIKGFRSTGPKTFLRTIHDSRGQQFTRRLMLAGAAGIFLLRLLR